MKTVGSGDSDDLRALTPARGADGKPLFRAREGGIDERFFQVQLAALVQMQRKQAQRLSQFAGMDPLLIAPMAGLERPLFFSHS